MRERSEIAIVAWGAATFGALLAAYSAFRPVRDALILDGDPDQIPWLFTGTLVVVGVVSPAWGAAVARQPRRVVPISFHVFAVCLAGFVALTRAQIAPVAIGRVFYVWSAVFNLFVVSVFWSLLADLLGPAVARRVYGPIAAGGTIGTVAGPALAKLLVGPIGVAGVLAMSALLLELAAFGASRVRRAAAAIERGADDPPVEGSAWSGLAHVARSRYLGAIVGYVLCTAVAATFIYLAQIRITKVELTGAAARTDFLATVDIWVAIVAFVIQTVIASPLIGRFGPGVVMSVLPLLQAAGIVLLVTAPSLPTLAIVLVVGKASTHGLTRPARELLFTVIPRADKYRAKNVIDTFVYRLGDFAGSWLRTGLAAIGGAALAAATLPLLVVWLGLATIVGVGFRRRVKELA